MRRYNVPRISFINKMDRPGANPWRVIGQIRQKLKIAAAAVQVPIGVEDDLRGVVDLVRWKAIYNEGEKGNKVVESDEIPAEALELAKEKRRELIEQLAEVDEEMGDLLIMEEEPTTAQLADAIRRATIGLKFSPVFLGSVSCVHACPRAGAGRAGAPPSHRTRTRVATAAATSPQQLLRGPVSGSSLPAPPPVA